MARVSGQYWVKVKIILAPFRFSLSYRLATIEFCFVILNLLHTLKNISPFCVGEKEGAMYIVPNS